MTTTTSCCSSFRLKRGGETHRVTIVTVWFLVVVSAAAARAQGVAGVVTDSINHVPIASAVVSVLDAAGATISHGLTNERGEYRIALTNAGQHVRVIRIGFAPRELRIPRPTAGDTRLDIGITALPNLLHAVQIIANARCPARKDRAAALGLWEQARAGLLAAVVSREENPASMYRLLYDRAMDRQSGRPTTMAVRADSVDSSASSFTASHSAEDLVHFGFATNSNEDATYFGPDADVLLSNYFVGAYCFQIADSIRSRPNQVGLHFSPSDRRVGRTDIDGTLWIDTVARELRDVEFRYVGLPQKTEVFHPGGQVSFRVMRNGVVLIDRWSLRLVSASEDTVMMENFHGALLTLRDRLYAEETGGVLLRATWRDGLVWKAPMGALRLHAITATDKPAAGTAISLVATPYFGIADSTGTIDISDLVAGPYVVRVIDPRVSAIGVGVPTTLRLTAFEDSTTVATLRVPTAEEFIVDRCRAAHQWTTGDSVFVLGRVVTPDGTPVSGAKVTFATRTRGRPVWHSDYFVTGADGLFQSCREWEAGTEALLRVNRVNGRDVDVTRTLADTATIVRVVVQPGH